MANNQMRTQQNRQQPVQNQQGTGGSMTEKQWLEGINARLVSELTKKKEAMPAGFNEKRFTMNCITVIQDMLKDANKKGQLKKIAPTSIVMCMVKGAYLGLDFFNGECYAIPYGNDMQFQTDYKGEVKLCKKHSKNPIKDIYAKVVREGDFFEEAIENGIQIVNFRPVPFSDAKTIGAFAVVLFKDGSMLYETMSAKEIEDIRNTFSKAKNSPAWSKTPGEMYKKTVLRRLCKMIDLDFDTIEAQEAFMDGGDNDFRGKGVAESTMAPVDVFAQPMEPRPAPAQIEAAPAAIEVDYEEFERQYEPESVPVPTGDEAPIQDDGTPLPFD